MKCEHCGEEHEVVESQADMHARYMDCIANLKRQRDAAMAELELRQFNYEQLAREKDDANNSSQGWMDRCLHVEVERDDAKRISGSVSASLGELTFLHKDAIAQRDECRKAYADAIRLLKLSQAERDEAIRCNDDRIVRLPQVEAERDAVTASAMREASRAEKAEIELAEVKAQRDAAVNELLRIQNEKVSRSS